MPSDVQVNQLIIYVGTQAQINAEKEAGRITDDDFVVVTDAPAFALASDLAAEITARINADNSLQTQINAKVSDVLMAGTSIVASNIARIPLATANNVGVVKVTSWSGLSIQNNTGVIFTNPATVEEIAEKTDSNKPITPLTLDDAVKAGIVDNYYTLSAVEKTAALNWLGAGTAAQGLKADSALQPADIVDNVTSTATNKALSANMGKSLQDQVNNKVTGNNAITGATKCKITYDSKGLVTAGADLSSNDITTALGYTPYDSSNPSGFITYAGTFYWGE